MSVKDCGHHDDDRKVLYRRLFGGVLALIVLILLVVLLIWLILRPTKPHFILLDATIYAFNVTAQNFLTSNIQVTLSSRNPNDRIGIYYDRLDVYASYRNQQITLPTSLPSTYQGHKDVNVWSPFVYGDSVPVAPYLAVALEQDQMVGTLLLKIKVDGRVRWKVGSFISGEYHMYVSCPAYIPFENYRDSGFPVGPGIKFQFVQNCHVDV